MPMTFDEWCDRVDEIFRTAHDWPRSFTHDCGRICFREYFDGGTTPEDQVQQEIEAMIAL